VPDAQLLSRAFPFLLGVAAVAQSDAAVQAPVPLIRAFALPAGIASFGAASAGGCLYVYGGHVGRHHVHSTKNAVGSFRRIDLAGGAPWQDLPEGPPLQGTALVTGGDGALYRVGGMSARNEPGQAEDLYSTASVQRFDQSRGAWEDCTPLPEPRSSHDAVVVDGKLYVAGGWQLAGGKDGEWHDTAWVADLAERPLRWTALPAPPFRRRACAVAAFGHRVAVIGGIEGSAQSRDVTLYDPATESWSAGPQLPGSGFGAAALGVGDSLYASIMDGRVLVLAPDAASWVPCGQLLLPRIFHRLALAATGDRLLVVGGAGRGGHMRSVEIVPLSGTREAAVHEWVLPFAGVARNRQTVVLKGDVLHLFGGNRGDGRDRFAPEQFTDEIWTIDLATFAVAAGGRLPSPRQSMAATSFGPRGDATLLLGGLGPVVDAGDGVAARSLADALVLGDGPAGARPFGAAMPGPRTQFDAVEHGGRIWVFGGVDFTPDRRGEGTAVCATEVLTCDVAQEPRAFADSGIELPRPRRSFGSAKLGAKYYLIGGLGDGFAPVDAMNVFDLETRQWSAAAAPPAAWVSPQACALGGRIYVACGGTMAGMRFTEDRSLAAFDPAAGTWTVVARLPFAARQTHMFAWRGRLLFFGAAEEPGAIAIRVLTPPGAGAVEASFRR
jgi:hypothetical protein